MLKVLNFYLIFFTWTSTPLMLGKSGFDYDVDNLVYVPENSVWVRLHWTFKNNLHFGKASFPLPDGIALHAMRVNTVSI